MLQLLKIREQKGIERQAELPAGMVFDFVKTA